MKRQQPNVLESCTFCPLLGYMRNLYDLYITTFYQIFSRQSRTFVLFADIFVSTLFDNIFLLFYNQGYIIKAGSEMKQKYIQFYEWYKDKGKILKYGVAIFILGFSYLMYFVWISLFLQAPFSSIGNDLGITEMVKTIDDISLLLSVTFYMAAPYIMTLFLFIIFLLYRSIFLKIFIAFIYPFSFFNQLGILMGFSSYWHFLYFLPQLLLFTAGWVFMTKARKWHPDFEKNFLKNIIIFVVVIIILLSILTSL